MTPSVDHAIQVLERFRRQPGPMDALLDLHFRAHPQAGSRDRRETRERVYTVLRHWRLLAGEQVVDPLTASVATMVQRAAQLPATDGLPPAQRDSLPDWLWHLLVACWGEGQADLLAHGLNQPASVDLRVHRLAREQALTALRNAGYDAQATPFSPDGIRLAEHRPLHQFPLFQSGSLEIQDEGSQLVSRVVAPCPGETVVDLCAGAGGKTLHLASLMHNKGRLLAADQAAGRLARLLPRAKRAGARHITTLALRHERDPRLHPWLGKAHRVLVDAPCSGTGTLRRNPEIKWRLTPEAVASLPPRQHALLAAGAALLAPAGRLVYATCSLLCSENQQVIQDFLADHPHFRLLSAPAILARQGITLPAGDDRFLLLAPHTTDCDGFFVAALERGR